MTSTSDGRSPEERGGHIRGVGALAGLGSGLAKVTVGHGFDTLKIRLQCSPPGTYRGTIDCLVRTVRDESFFALYKGITPPLVGQAAIDSTLLGALHNYRLLFMRAGFVEDAPLRARYVGDLDTLEGNKRLTLLGHGFAGLCAGLTSAIVATPIELLKVKLQVQLQRDVASRQFKSTADCALQVLRAQGLFGGLWRGYLTSTAYRSSFFWMFLSIEGLMRSFERLDGTPFEMGKGASHFWAGGLASLSFWVFGIPIDNLKNRIFASPLDAPRISPLTLARDVWRAEGAGGFYKGFAPCVLRAFPANACAYFAFNWIMTHLGAEDVRGQS